MKTTFQTGTTYVMHSPCDHDCTWMYKVVKRTAKTVTLQQIRRDGSTTGATQVCRITTDRYDGDEVCSPLGRYSMSPVLCANRIYKH